ncbi:MAG: GFA family protein [Sphingomicrobium sp.]
MDHEELVAACHCGKARIEISRRPDYINECNCSLCARSGWRGIYFASDELVIQGEFDRYVRTDLQQPCIAILRCATCGCFTHWVPLSEPPYDRMGVNARLVDPALLQGIEVREIDGKSWDG